MLRGGRIQALNNAITEVLPHLRDEARANPHAELLVRVLAFANEPAWVVEEPTPVDQICSWQRLEAVPQGFTELGSALHELADVAERAGAKATRLSRRRSSWSPTAGPRRAAAPRSPRASRSCSTTRWGEAAVRLALGVGRDADMHSLRRFIGNEDVPAAAGRQPRAARRVHRLGLQGRQPGRLAAGRSAAPVRPRAPRSRRVRSGDPIWSTLGQ